MNENTFVHIVMWCDENGVFHSREHISHKPLPDPLRGQLMAPTFGEVVKAKFGNAPDEE